MKKAKKRRTHFVPRVVFEAAFAGVVPVCVAATHCESNATGGPAPSEAGGIASGSPPIGTSMSVANECFGTLTWVGGTYRCCPPGEVCSGGTVAVGSSSGGASRADAGVADVGLAVLEAGDAHGDGLLGGDVAAEAFVSSDAPEAGNQQEGGGLAVADAAFVPDGDTG